jgi:hypothetical protein
MQIVVSDGFKGHLTKGVKKEMRKANTHLMTPGGMTSQLGGTRVISKPFTDHC